MTQVVTDADYTSLQWRLSELLKRRTSSNGKNAILAVKSILSGIHEYHRTFDQLEADVQQKINKSIFVAAHSDYREALAACLAEIRDYRVSFKKD